MIEVLTRKAVFFLFASAAASAIGCSDSGGARFAAGVVTPDEAPFGPKVIFDPLALPVPDVPMPSDLLLERDPAGSGALQWNVSTRAPTALERNIREDLKRLDGFGSFGPITVGFDAPIELTTVTGDSVVVVNITRGHPEEGRSIPLDLGRGAFPLAGRGSYWPFDVFADAPDFLFGFDNMVDRGAGPVRVEHYEVETNTLMIRPRDSLAPGATYAVLLTRAITGLAPTEDPTAGGRPIRSPFPYKAHAAQAPLVGRALALAGLTTQDLAFGWTFTTGKPAERLTRVRDGLYGHGDLAGYAAALPPSFGEFRDTGIGHDADGTTYPASATDHRFIVQGAFLDAILGLFLGLAEGFSTELNYVEYVAFGSFPSVDVTPGDRGVFAPEDNPEIIYVPYLVAIPKETDLYHPPFKTVIYFHGTASSRFEFLSIANNLARVGVATVAYDQVGHGPIIPDIRKLLSEQGLSAEAAAFFVPLLADLLAPDRAAEFEDITFAEALEKFNKIGLFAELATIGRTTDGDGDGAITSGESFFFADPFQQCGGFQQDLVDLFALVRTLRSLDATKVPGAVDSPANAPDALIKASMAAGDFNADGRLDIGGPTTAIGLAGVSLGGFHALMGAAIEPEVTTVTPIAAGGGVADILLRSTLRQITRVIYLDVFGPLIVGCPDGAGGYWLSLNNESGNCGKDPALYAFGYLDNVGAGSTVVATNVENGEVSAIELVADEAGFAIAVPSDRWDQLRIDATDRDGGTRTLWVVTPYQGLGLERNTPDFRRFLTITQHALDGCDPIAFARHIFRDPLPGHLPKKVLFESAAADVTVPISTGIALARATGVFGEGAAAEAVVNRLIDAGVVIGQDIDVDGTAARLGLTDPAATPLGPFPPVASGDGISAIRFAFTKGRHEWVAGPTTGALYPAHTLSRNRIAIFHASGGRVISDDLCLLDESCELLDDPAAWSGP